MAVLLTLSLSHFVAASLIYLYHNLKCIKCIRLKSFDKFIYNYVFCKYIGDNNFFRLNFFPNPVISYFNICCLSMKFRICYK